MDIPKGEHTHGPSCKRCNDISFAIKGFIDSLVAAGCNNSEIAMLLIRNAVDHAAENGNISAVIEEFNYTQFRMTPRPDGPVN